MLSTKHKPKVRANRKSQYTVIRLDKQLSDDNLHKFENVLEPLMKTNHSYLVFDLGDLEFMNSKVIGYFAVTHDRLRENNKKIVFLNASPELRRILDLVGLTQMIPHFEGEDELLRALEEEEL